MLVEVGCQCLGKEKKRFCKVEKVWYVYRTGRLVPGLSRVCNGPDRGLSSVQAMKAMVHHPPLRLAATVDYLRKRHTGRKKSPTDQTHCAPPALHPPLAATAYQPPNVPRWGARVRSRRFGEFADDATAIENRNLLSNSRPVGLVMRRNRKVGVIRMRASLTNVSLSLTCVSRTSRVALIWNIRLTMLTIWDLARLPGPHSRPCSAKSPDTAS